MKIPSGLLVGRDERRHNGAGARAGDPRKGVTRVDKGEHRADQADALDPAGVEHQISLAFLFRASHGRPSRIALYLWKG